MLTKEERIAVLKNTEEFAKKYMSDYDISHNYDHVVRVKNLATQIAISEAMSNEDIFEIQIAALLHDISDHKYTCDIYAQETILREFFKDSLLNDTTINNIIKIACNVSLSKETSDTYNKEHIKDVYLKLNCVQDADRIDSLGSFGIFRYIVFGVVKNNSSMDEIVCNIETRTNILMKNIKTNYGLCIAYSKYNVIKIFLDDYNKNNPNILSI